MNSSENFPKKERERRRAAHPGAVDEVRSGAARLGGDAQRREEVPFVMIVDRVQIGVRLVRDRVEPCTYCIFEGTGTAPGKWSTYAQARDSALGAVSSISTTMSASFGRSERSARSPVSIAMKTSSSFASMPASSSSSEDESSSSVGSHTPGRRSRSARRSGTGSRPLCPFAERTSERDPMTARSGRAARIPRGSRGRACGAAFSWRRTRLGRPRGRSRATTQRATRTNAEAGSRRSMLTK